MVEFMVIRWRLIPLQEPGVVGFTKIASTLSPEKLLSELDECYSHFDRIVQMKGIEKIKTIGDSYMAAAGITESKRLHAVDAVLSALKIH